MDNYFIVTINFKYRKFIPNQCQREFVDFKFLDNNQMYNYNCLF